MTDPSRYLEWNDGKYGAQVFEGYQIRTYRHREPWPSKDDAAVGDNFLLSLLQTLETVADQRDHAIKMITEQREEVRGMMDSLDNHVISNTAQRLNVYEVLHELWKALDPALVQTLPGDADLTGTTAPRETKSPEIGA